MFTDIAGYTRLTQEDEAGALRLLKEQERIVRPILELHHGRKVKTIGDGLLVEFRSALEAVECGVDLQAHFAARNAREGPPELRLRIGIHLGDVRREGPDIVGDAVNVASRMEALADPGDICISSQVFEQVSNKVSYRLEKLGPRKLKGVRDPVDVYRVMWIGPPPTPPETVGVIPKLAVLPLANISPDPKDEYFADGLTEELISVLSQIKELRVISRTSVSQYRGTSKPIAQIASELGVSSVLEGSVRKAGDQLRIAVQLIDPKTEERLWTKTFDRRLENIFAIQTEVAAQTALALRIQLARSEQEAIDTPPTTNLEAYGLYLQGLGALHSDKFYDWDRAVSLFEESVRSDPAFALAHAHLANALVAAAGELRPFRDVIPRARAAVRHALDLAPLLSEAHVASGNLAYQGDADWGRAEAEFRKALELNPSSSTARLWYGILLVTVGRFDEAAAQLRGAAELDPDRRDIVYLHLARALAYSGDHAGALAVGRECTSRFPGSTSAHLALALSLLAVNQTSEAEAEARKCVEIAANEPTSPLQLTEARVYLASIRSRMGDPREAQRLLQEWAEDPGRQPLRMTYRAAVLAAVGRFDEALAVLETARGEDDSLLSFDYQAFYLDPIRGDPRFRRLLDEKRLPAFPPAHRARRSTGA